MAGAPTIPPPVASAAPGAPPGKLRHTVQRFTRRIRKIWKERSSAPWVVSLPAPDLAWDLPADFSADSFPGLLHLELVRGGTVARVLSFWQGQDFFQRQRASFIRAAGIPIVEFEGFVAHCRPEKPKWWQEWWHGMSGREVVLAVGALGGAVLALNDFGAKLWVAFVARPIVVVAADMLSPVRVREGSPIAVSVTLQNTGSGSVDATCENCRLEPVGEKLNKLDLKAETGSIPRLAPGQIFELRLRGAGRAADPRDPAWDRYILRGSLGATSGWFGGTSHPPLPAREVQIWPALAWSAPRFKQRIDHYGLFETHIYAGEARESAMATVELENAEGVQVLSVHDDRDQSYPARIESSPDKYDWQIHWNPALSAFRERAFVITLQSPLPRDESAWKAWEPRVSMRIE